MQEANDPCCQEDARWTSRRIIFLQIELNGHHTYLSPDNGYVLSEKYLVVLMLLWNEIKGKLPVHGQKKGIKFDNNLFGAFLLYVIVKRESGACVVKRLIQRLL
ncbi:hypothetical protein VNO77_36057 [Canavalia gladiata]|uniref:Uncharacterized protein n=1 Tax=Canavalia gladiata TaxID=3824 RepID=A0AAN9K8T0_CANGL